LRENRRNHQGRRALLVGKGRRVFKEEPSPEDINLVLRNGAIDGMLDALGEGSSSGGPSKHLIKGDLV
jgi:hypothetical protein